MNEKEETFDNGFNIPLVIGVYLVLEVIVLFVLCLIEINGVSHDIMLGVSFLLEFLATIFVIRKSNIKSSVIFYILLLVAPVFLNLIAMGMHYVTGKIPFTPTILLLFRSGYTLKGEILNSTLRFIISFRVPALIAIMISSLIFLITKNRRRKLS